MAKYENKTENRARKVLWIAILILSLGIIGAAVYFAIPMLSPEPAIDTSGLETDVSLPTTEVTEPTPSETETEPIEPSETEPATTEPTEPRPDNRVDWTYYKGLNSDVYAWIYIPGTGIDLPVLQSWGAQDDNFYLHHDMYGNYDYNGIPYTQKANAKDFSDPVTVIYGHNMLRDGVMFTNLLYFQDAEFFEENEFFYIYQPNRVLTYRIVSAHVYDTRHILNSFDFSKDEDFQEYLDYILAPRTVIKNVREGVELTTEDRIVTLSTCTRVNGEKVRYLIQGVLVDDQRTN